MSDKNISFLFDDKSIYSVLNVPLNALQGYHDHNHTISTVLKKAKSYETHLFMAKYSVKIKLQIILNLSFTMQSNASILLYADYFFLPSQYYFNAHL